VTPGSECNPYTRVPAEQLQHRHPPSPDYGDSGGSGDGKYFGKGGARAKFGRHGGHGHEGAGGGRGGPFGDMVRNYDDDGAAGGGSFSEVPTLSYAHFNFSCHVVEVGPKVLDIFEQSIEIFSRPIGGGNASTDSSSKSAPGVQGEPRRGCTTS
jgi:hypothetical protein